jgi:NADH:ubiquinone oxidoreductase subunit
MASFLKRISATIRAMPVPFSSSRLIGKDLAGNSYYESASTREGMSTTRRYIEYAKGDPYSDYTPEGIPPQWQAWL